MHEKVERMWRCRVDSKGFVEGKRGAKKIVGQRKITRDG